MDTSGMPTRTKINRTIILFALTMVVLIGCCGYLWFERASLKARIQQERHVQQEQRDRISHYQELIAGIHLHEGGYTEAASEVFNDLRKRSQDSTFLLFIDAAESMEPFTQIEEIVQVVEKESDSGNVLKRLEAKNDSLLSAFRSQLDEMKVELAVSKEKERRLSAIEKKDTLLLTSTKGTAFKYYGPIKGGKAEGYGVGVFESGSVYEGNWRNNMRHGKGVYTWADNERYEGDFKDDKRHGKGRYFWNNGEIYEGEWADDKRHGAGVIYRKNGNVKTDGTWQNDELVKKN